MGVIAMRLSGFLVFLLASCAILASQPQVAQAVKLGHAVIPSTYDDKCKAEGGTLKWDGNGLCWRCSKRNMATMKAYTLWCKD
jgi:hypothetical protein